MSYAELIRRSDWACSEAIKYYQKKEYDLARFYKNVSKKYKKEAEETYVY